MPTKNFSGSLINYGTTLPPTATTPDGALFFKVGGSDEGLYLFSFISDTDLGTFGSQSGQNWVPLTGTSSTIDADTFGGQPPSYYQTANTILDGVINLGAATGIVVKNGASTFTTRAVVPASIPDNAAGTRILVNNGAGTGGNIEIDVNQQNLSLNSIGGTLSVSKGGTGLTAAVDGGILYGATTSTVAFTAAGTSGYLLQSGGTGIPSWVDPSGLTVSNANYANSAGTAGSATTAGSLNPGADIDVTGPVGNTGYIDATAATFTGGSSVSIRVNSINSNLLTASIPTDLVLWNRISNLDTGSRTFSGWPIATTTTYSRPSLFHDMGGNSITSNPSMQPADFLPRSLTGFDGYNTDMGFYQVGFTAVGGTSGAKALQLAANWDSEETTPSRQLRYRVNDDNGTLATWGPWQYIVDEGSPILSTFVAKAGDTMSGPLYVYNGLRGVSLNPGGGTNTGFVEFKSVVGREGYIGNSSSVSSADSGTIRYVAGNHAFTGAASVSGSLVLGGTTALSSSTGLTIYAATALSVPAVSTDADNLVINGTGGNGITIFSASTAPGSINFGDNSSSTAAQFIYNHNGDSFSWLTGGTLRASLDSGGNLFVAGSISTNGNVTAYASSDGRLKRDIVTIEGALSKVKALRGVDYTMKESGRRETGLIAQEVMNVVPEVVRSAPDGMYGVAYGNLVGLLIEAIKEQQQQIDELKAQLNK